MAISLCFSPLIAFNTIKKPGIISHHYNSRRSNNWIKDSTYYTFKGPAFQELKATDNKPSTKPNSILCADCDGNGTGANLVDHFNGEFKAGARCWICSGKKVVLCGNCNGAGFIGGFMSTFDE